MNLCCFSYCRADSFFCRNGRHWKVIVLAALILALGPFASSQELPSFQVPGREREMALLEKLLERHHSPKITCTLWDDWLPMSVLWPAVGPDGSESAAPLRDFYRHSLSARHIDSAGYVNMNQHRGLAHPGGWPFPTWHQSGGIGWHFTHADDPYSIQLKVPLAPLEGMKQTGVKDARIDPAQGLVFSTDGGETTLSHVHPFQVNTLISPFITVEWSGVPPSSNPRIEFTTEAFPEFDESRSVPVPLEDAPPGLGLMFSMVPMFTHPEWKDHFTGLRLRWENAEPQEVVVRSVHTAVDSRHPITNSLFVMGCADFFRWTGEVEFLKQNIDRIRKVVAYARSEFAFEENGCVLVRWVGHDGRRGFEPGPTGQKKLNFGHGVGNNYYDLVPFGHRDCYASILLYAALKDAVELERAIEANPAWEIATPGEGYASAAELESLAGNLKEQASAMFWNEGNGRFYGCFDADGVAYDYGFTFLNLEAIYYGFASDEQARSILDWLDGKRIVEGDTSIGDDIYHWRFAPRATTRRNVEWYGWVWHGPETIPWGGQIQDGGAVLGFSYHDLMSRLRMNGPDDAWQRLQVIIDWFEEVEAEGGYRAYYAKPNRGSLQGGGTPGGLGMDHEFFESVLVPQVMLYGFLGFKPTADGVILNPRLPKRWAELSVSRIHYHDHIFDLKVTPDEVVIHFRQRAATDPVIRLPEGDTREVRFEEPGFTFPPAPRIETDAAGLQRAKERVASGQEPFATYWRLAVAEAEAALSLEPQPIDTDDALAFHGAAQTEGIAARLLAYRWRLEDHDLSGEKAVALLDAWASANPLPGTQLNPEIRFPNAGMDVARGMLPFIAAYDLLDGHPSLTDEKRSRIEAWFRGLVPVIKEGIQRWETNDDFGGQKFQNHHVSHVLGLALLGSALRDRELIQFALDSPENPKDFRELLDGLILMPGDTPHGGLRGKPLHPGEIQDRVRTNHGAGLTYCHLSMTLLLYAAEVLSRATGEDWVNAQAPGGETLRLSATFYSDFFRLRNARINGDYYFRDHAAVQNNQPFLGIFEVALGHWPDVPYLKAAVRSMNRAHTPRSWLNYYGLPLLTHGVDQP